MADIPKRLRHCSASYLFAVAGRGRTVLDDLILPSSNDFSLDPFELKVGIFPRVAGVVNIVPGGANVTVNVDRIALFPVQLITRIGVLHLTVSLVAFNG